MTADVETRAHALAMGWLRDQVWLAKNAPVQPKVRPRFIAPKTFTDDDVLKSIAPAIYVEALTPGEFSAHGWTCCPFPDHDDQTPSFRAYPDPDEGWYCYGCNRGGTIYDFAGALWGLSTRGSAFIELRRRLADELLRRGS
jgi:CHC2 zinc finger